VLDSCALGVQAAHLSPADVWLATATAPEPAMGLPLGGKIAVSCPVNF
jgi:cytosine deaminase